MGRFGIWAAACLLLSSGIVLAGPAAVSAGSPTALAVHAEAIPPGPYAHMHTLYEKTFLRIDVLTLEVRFDSTTALRVRQTIETQPRSKETDNRVVELVLTTPDAWARMEFLRSASAEQFFGGIRSSLEKALAAGYISEDYFAALNQNLPRWFDFLVERQVQKGDVLLYRITSDSLRTVYRGIEGQVLLDQTEAAPRARSSILGGYLAPGSPFRKGLLESMYED